MEALVTAGGICKPDEPLYPLAGDQPKALLPMVGKPMVQWVLDALAESQSVDRVTIIGLDASADVHCGNKPVDFTPDAGDLLDNTASGVQHIHQRNPSAEYVLLVASDLPLISPQMVDWVVAQSENETVDFVYNIVRKSLMVSRFPESRRSYVRLKEGYWCGGDMNITHTRLVQGVNPAWRRIAEARKNARKQAALVGLGTLILLLTRQLTLEKAIEVADKRLGVRAKVLDSPFAEIGMDVDKPFQYEIACRELESRTQ